MVPTWNYSEVQLRVSVTVHDDPDWVLDVVTGSPSGTRAGASGRGRSPMRRRPTCGGSCVRSSASSSWSSTLGSRGVEGKAKLSQNRSAADRRGVIAGLRAEGGPPPPRHAGWQTRWSERWTADSRSDLPYDPCPPTSSAFSASSGKHRGGTDGAQPAVRGSGHGHDTSPRSHPVHLTLGPAPRPRRRRGRSGRRLRRHGRPRRRAGARRRRLDRPVVCRPARHAAAHHPHHRTVQTTPPTCRPPRRRPIATPSATASSSSSEAEAAHGRVQPGVARPGPPHSDRGEPGVHERHDGGPLTAGGGDALHRARPDVARGKDPGERRLEVARAAGRHASARAARHGPSARSRAGRARRSRAASRSAARRRAAGRGRGTRDARRHPSSCRAPRSTRVAPSPPASTTSEHGCTVMRGL